MKKSRYVAPYNAKGRTSFPETIGKSGVYVIKEEGRTVYVGSSKENLYKTMYRHFEHWNHKYQEVVTYVSKMKRKKYTVSLVVCTPAQAVRLERLLIMKHKPRDNKQLFKDYAPDKWDENIKKQHEAAKPSSDLLTF